MRKSKENYSINVYSCILICVEIYFLIKLIYMDKLKLLNGMFESFFCCQSRNNLVEYVIVGKVYANDTIPFEIYREKQRITI